MNTTQAVLKHYTPEEALAAVDEPLTRDERFIIMRDAACVIAGDLPRVRPMEYAVMILKYEQEVQRLTAMMPERAPLPVSSSPRAAAPSEGESK